MPVDTAIVFMSARFAACMPWVESSITMQSFPGVFMSSEAFRKSSGSGFPFVTSVPVIVASRRGLIFSLSMAISVAERWPDVAIAIFMLQPFRRRISSAAQGRGFMYRCAIFR